MIAKYGQNGGGSVNSTPPASPPSRHSSHERGGRITFQPAPVQPRPVASRGGFTGPKRNPIAQHGQIPNAVLRAIMAANSQQASPAASLAQIAMAHNMPAQQAAVAQRHPGASGSPLSFLNGASGLTDPRLDPLAALVAGAGHAGGQAAGIPGGLLQSLLGNFQSPSLHNIQHSGAYYQQHPNQDSTNFRGGLANSGDSLPQRLLKALGIG